MPPFWPLLASPAPMIFTLGRLICLAISALVTINAPPPSDTMQQSRRCNGSEIMGEFMTSSTVTRFCSMAFGLC